MRSNIYPSGGRIWKDDASTIDVTKVFDPVSGCITQLELEHAKIHVGDAFLLIADITLSGTTPAFRLFRTNSKFLHFKEVKIVTELPDLVVQLFEEPTVTATGTAALPISYNRTTNNDPGCLVFSGPTVTANGTLIDQYYLPGGEGPGQSATGESQGAEWEYILKPNTDYLIRAARLAGSTGNSRTLIKYKWYIGGPL